MVLTNYILEYRHKLFNSLSDSCDIDIHVLQCQPPSDDGRIGNFNFEDAKYFKYTLKRIKVGKLSVNYELGKILYLLRNMKFNFIIISDNIPNIITSFLLNIFSKVLNKGTKIILWSEDFEYSSPYIARYKLYTKKTINFFLKRFINLNLIDAVLTFNEKDYTILSEVFGKKVIRVSQATHTRHEVLKFNPLLTELKDFPTFGYLGYLNKIKNIDLILNFFSASRKYKLLVAGGGSQDLIEKIKKANNNIEYLGFLKAEEEKNEFFKRVHYLVLPSFYDTWGLVVNEASHRGVPSIISKYALSSEIIRKAEYNLIFNPYDYEDFQRSIDFAANLSFENYNNLRRDIQKVSLDYTIDVFVENFSKILKNYEEKNRVIDK